jgi:hypothetical protein
VRTHVEFLANRQQPIQFLDRLRFVFASRAM